LNFEGLDNGTEEIDPKHKELLEEGLPLIPIENDEDSLTFMNSTSTAKQGNVSEICQESSPIRDQENLVGEHQARELNPARELCKGGAKRKTTEFNHLLERKTFRMLRKYYKNSFEKFAAPINYKKKVKTMTTNQMDQLVNDYIQHEFDFLTRFFTGNDLAQLIICLKRIILSDRYKKAEKVVLELDFANTRDLFNKYSRKARNEWLKLPTNSLLLVHFYLKQGKNQCYSQKDVNAEKLHHQMRFLVSLSFEHLHSCFVEIFSDESCKIDTL